MQMHDEKKSIHPVTETDIPVVTRVEPMAPRLPKKLAVPTLIAAAALGLVSGIVINQMMPTKSPTSTAKAAATKDDAQVETVNTDKKAGIIDKKTFKDSARGILREGGIEGEGSYYLERGAKDQNAYLTSSAVDLSKFVGKKVEVWGATMQSQKAGWLMDVGLVEEVK